MLLYTLLFLLLNSKMEHESIFIVAPCISLSHFISNAHTQNVYIKIFKNRSNMFRS